jgi:hypothetical protein
MGDGRCGSRRGGVAVGGMVWQGWQVRFPASEVMLILSFSFVPFQFPGCYLLCFCCIFFSFLLSHHISIFSFFHIFIFSKFIAPP